uniref:BACK domain-containing protein n=1 Tax=Capitella teleta TaxID=283909 RepID=X2B7Z4_CAPTE
MVKFFYTGDIKLTAENIKAIVAGSEFLCCKHLKAYCEEFLMGNVGLSNCIDYYQLGKIFNLKVLIKTAFDFILSKFREFREISNFDKLTEDELAEVVSCDRLNAENEDVVFEAVVHWVNADLDVREEVFPRIAPLIRFPFCTQTMLTDKICCSSLVLKSECIQLAHEAVCEMKWETLMPCNTATFDRVVTSPFGLYLIEKSNCYFVEPKLKRLTTLPWKPADKWSTLAFIDGKIFAFGGGPASKSVKSINLKESNPKWKSEQEMLHEVFNPIIVQFANKVYAYRCGWGTSVTQEFDPALNEWRMRSQIPGCCCGSAVALGDKIYVVGGIERVCYSYDPKNDEW